MSGMKEARVRVNQEALRRAEEERKARVREKIKKENQQSRKRLRSLFDKWIDEVVAIERDIRHKYSIYIKYSDGLIKESDTLLSKYSTSSSCSSYEISDKQAFKTNVTKVKQKLGLLNLELGDIEREILFLRDIIVNLREDGDLKNELERLNHIQSSQKRKEALELLKEKIKSHKKDELDSSNAKQAYEEKRRRVKEQNRQEAWVEKIGMMVEKIRVLEPDYKLKFDLEKQRDRLSMIANNLVVEYNKIKRERVKEEEGPIVEEEEHSIATTMISNLKKLGYEIVDEDIERFKEQEEIYIPIPHTDGYKFRIGFNGEKYKVKFVRFVGSDYSENLYEKQRDQEVANEWCGDYSKFVGLLEESGILVEHTLKVGLEAIEYLEVFEGEISDKDTGGAIGGKVKESVKYLNE